MASQKRSCPCCGYKLDARTIAAHLRRQGPTSVLIAQQQNVPLQNLFAIAGTTHDDESDPIQSSFTHDPSNSSPPEGISSDNPPTFHDPPIPSGFVPLFEASSSGDDPISEDDFPPPGQIPDAVMSSPARSSSPIYQIQLPQEHTLLFEPEDGAQAEAEGGAAEESEDEAGEASIGGEDRANKSEDSSPDSDGLDPLTALGENWDQWFLQNGRHLNEEDLLDVRGFNLKVLTNMNDRTYDFLPRCFPTLRGLHSSQRLSTRTTQLSGFSPVDYDCCVNSCILYVDAYEADTECRFCHEPRYDKDHKPRNTFSYLPLIPQLVSLFNDPQTAKSMKYRSKRTRTEGVYQDVFDGSRYQQLVKERVQTPAGLQDYTYFNQPTDIALGLSTDGCAPFKNRTETCWLLVFWNYNIRPEDRFHLENAICVGVIPGPKSPKDMDSFLFPAVKDLKTLSIGVTAFDSLSGLRFLLRAFLIVLFGDMPAVKKCMRMKGPNGFSPCRECRILGDRDPSSDGPYYTPLYRPTDPFIPRRLPLRNHIEFMRLANQVANAPTPSEEATRARDYGINGIPILSTLGSIDFPKSFPHDFMHMMMENVLPTLLSLWTGEHRVSDDGDQNYMLEPKEWEEIGMACADSGDLIPSVFGSRVPNPASERHYMTAESYLNFATLLAPPLLRRRFHNPVYYDHFIQLVKLINKCLQFEISVAEVDEIEEGFADWVIQYEAYYYQYKQSRLPVCTLPIHALLHVAENIRAMGPVQHYWAFPMERVCGSVMRTNKCRKAPYHNINRGLWDAIKLRLIKHSYDVELPSITLPQSDNVEGRYAEYQDVDILSPRVSTLVESSDRRAIIKYFAGVNNVNVTDKGLPTHLYQIGGIRMHGDVVRTSELAPASQHRDTSFIRYLAEGDKRYGQVLRIYEVPVSVRAATSRARSWITVLLAMVLPARICDVNELGMSSYKYSLSLTAVDVDNIERSVGRVKDGNQWTIIERLETLN